MKKLFKLIRNWKNAEVWVRQKMNHPVSVPIVGRYCLVFYEGGEIGYWLYEQNDWAHEELKNIKEFIQL